MSTCSDRNHRHPSYRTSVCATVLVPLILVGGGVCRAEQEFECLVEPYVTVQLSSGVPGILEEVLVDRGDLVAAGQIVANLESDVERAQYELVKARAEFAARRVKRNEDLYLRQMISIHEKDELETEANLVQLEMRETEERLKQRTVRSPIDAVVVERKFSAGEFVHEDPIMKLAQIDPLRVEVTIPMSLFGQVRVGMEAEVEWEAPGVGTHAATVTVVDPLIDAASGTIGVRLELPNPGHRLPAGSQCRVRLPID